VLFLVTGLFPWLSYTEAILRGTNALVQNAAYLRRMSIPTEIFIAKNSLLALFSLLIYLMLLLAYFLISGRSIGMSLLILPFLAVLLQLSAFGVTLVTAHLRILFPDIGEVLPTILQLWRWLLPILYSFDVFPELLQKILKLNPPYYFIESFRTIFLDNKLPGTGAWLNMLLWTAFLLTIGFFTAAKLRTDVVDEL
jgi:ABC-type polysaccharide/polyol phosphate export permease